MVIDVFNSIANRNDVKPGDYIDNDGFLKCAKCNTRKQSEITCPFNNVSQKVSVMCECEAQENQKQQEEQRKIKFKQRVQTLRRDGLTDPEYLTWVFDKDDGRQPVISCACRKYVDEWESMLSDNVGLLLYGGVGTGKSFFACCIANALLDKCVPALVTNFPRILNKLQSSGWREDRNELFDRLQRYDFVVIDDLGVERGTEYALEQVYAVIDTRYRSGKPLIVTTNLAPDEIKKPENLAYERIYDRILENCIPVKISGKSRRPEKAAEKRKKFQGLLGLE